MTGLNPAKLLNCAIRYKIFIHVDNNIKQQQRIQIKNTMNTIKYAENESLFQRPFAINAVTDACSSIIVTNTH